MALPALPSGVSCYVAWSSCISGKRSPLILLGRFLVASLYLASIVYWTPFQASMEASFTIQSAMPVMINAPVVARLLRSFMGWLRSRHGDRDDPGNHGGDPYLHSCWWLNKETTKSSLILKTWAFLYAANKNCNHQSDAHPKSGGGLGVEFPLCFPFQ